MPIPPFPNPSLPQWFFMYVFPWGGLAVAWSDWRALKKVAVAPETSDHSAPPPDYASLFGTRHGDLCHYSPPVASAGPELSARIEELFGPLRVPCAAPGDVMPGQRRPPFDPSRGRDAEAVYPATQVGCSRGGCFPGGRDRL